MRQKIHADNQRALQLNLEPDEIAFYNAAAADNVSAYEP
jgi:hypothetical protein